MINVPVFFFVLNDVLLPDDDMEDEGDMMGVVANGDGVGGSDANTDIDRLGEGSAHITPYHITLV
jgi:hypothetical protein